MTGFGAAEGNVAGRCARVEIRTVNHRWFNLATRVPGELAGVEGELREALRREFERGHISVHVRWIDETPVVAAIDTARAAAVVAALRELQQRFGLAGELTIDTVARQADIFSSRSAGESPTVPWSAIAGVVACAAAECRAARQREGHALTAEVADRIAALECAAQRINALAPARLIRERDRLAASIGRLIDDRTLDEARVAHEIAIAADRWDITEELVRFRAHLDAAREALKGPQAVGKPLGFLAQELGREANTIGAKANDVQIAHEVVAMKGEIEKIREQLENIE